MNFLSLNVCGIREANKRMSLMQWLSHRRVDIVCFQETHTISSTESSSWFSPFGFLAVSAAGTAHARGLAILFRPRLFLNRSWVELGGRFVMAEFMDGNFLFRVVCIYAPNRNPERDSFLLSCSDFIDPSIPTLLGGDFNAVFDRTKDRKGSAADSAYRDSSISLRSLFSEACVFDVWRRLHPDTIAFSWTRRDGLLASRIDLFGCPVSWAHGVHACDLIPCPYSDHVAIVLRVSPPAQLHRGPGRWKLNLSVLRDPAFVSLVESFWASWRQKKSNFRSIQLWWDRGKEHIRGLAISFCSRRKSLRDRERSLLVDLATHLKTKIDYGSVSLMDTYENVLARIADFDRLKAEGARVRARVQWAEEGEMSSRYFLRLEKKHGADQWIAAMRGADGEIVSDIDGICQSWVTFFSSLFSAEEVDLKTQENLLANLSARLPSSASSSCEGPITSEEARKALEGAATGKSPGSDGLPAEFFSVFWHVLGEDLVEVLNASLAAGRLPSSQRRALITLLFKKGDRLDPKNWRPISLLNTDYKILARVLAGRTLGVLHHVINPDQSCGVRGRYTGENIVLLNSIFQYCLEAAVPGALLSLDQEKAFDRVDHSFLFSVLSHVGFGPSYISWVKLLYSGISSVVCVNGYMSDAFHPTRGVRQGCPLSPLLYILTIEVLAASLRANGDIPGLLLPGVSSPLPVVSLYADDTTVIALSDSAILEVFRVYALFEAGTGSKLNLSKCGGLWLGPWRFRTNPPVDIQWSSDKLKVLGILIGYGDMGEANWRPRVEAFCRCIDAWRSRALSYSGRAVVLNLLALSRIWYVASVVPMPDSIKSELTTRIFNFFWAGKRDLVARKVLHHTRQQGGFSVVSVEFKLHSLLAQWFRRFGISPGAWVSLLTFWCFDRFGVPPLAVLSHPSAYAITTLPAFFCRCFQAWIALDGSVSGGDPVVGSAASGGPFPVSSMSTKACYDLLLSLNPARPHCVGKFLPLFGPWEWSSTWTSLFFMPLDRQVIDLNWRLAHGVLYTAERLASFGYQLQLACFCGHHLESYDHLFFHCPLAQSGLAWVQTLLSRACPSGPSFTLRHIHLGFSPGELRSVPRVFAYLINVCSYLVWRQRNDFRFRSIPPSTVRLIALMKARLSFYLPLFAKRFSSRRRRSYFFRQWAAKGMFGSFQDSAFVFSLQ